MSPNAKKVHYLATAALFRNPLLARLLVALGVIPVYRKADDPDIDEDEMGAPAGGVFYPGPGHALSAGDGRLVPLDGTPLRLLAAPAQPVSSFHTCAG